MSMSSPNWPSRSSRFGNGGGGGDSLVKTQQWRFQTVREQNWWSPSIGGFGSFGPPLEERRFERILQERNLRVWERSSSQPHQHQQTMAVVSLRELPIERRRPPPPPPRTRQPPPSSIPPPQQHGQTAAPAIHGHGHPTQKEQVLVQQQQIQEEIQWRASGQSQNGGMPTAGIRIGQQPTAPAERPPSRIVEYSSKQAAVNVEPEEEITNEPDGFRIRVEARGFGNEDFKISINASRVLALDAEHVEDNGNGTITIRKLNRRWKLADDIDQRSIHAYMGADQHIMILGLKVSAEAPTTTNMEEENKAAADGPEEEMNVQQMNVVQQEQFFPVAVDDSDQGSVQQAPPSTPAAMPSMSEEHQQYQRL